jgi:hypothetical protein
LLHLTVTNKPKTLWNAGTGSALLQYHIISRLSVAPGFLSQLKQHHLRLVVLIPKDLQRNSPDHATRPVVPWKITDQRSQISVNLSCKESLPPRRQK